MTEQSLTGRNIAVRGYEPPDVGVVVSGVEVVPAGFDVEVIAAVAERVDVRYVIRVVGHIVTAAVRYAYMLSPCVVLVLRHKCSRRVADRRYISLKVLVVPVLRSVVLKTYHAAGGIVYVVDRPCSTAAVLVVRALLIQDLAAVCSVHCRVIRQHLTETSPQRRPRFCVCLDKFRERSILPYA